LVKALAEVFGPAFKEGIAAAFNWLFRGSPVVLRVLAALSLATFVALTFYLWSQMTNAGSAFMDTLATPLFQTAQTYKGLEAFIMSEQSSQFQEKVKDLNVSSAFADWAKRLEDQVKASVPQPDLQKPVALKLDHFAVAADTRIQSSFLTDAADGFLFVPGIAVYNRALFKSASSSGELSLPQKDDPNLYRDVVITQSIAGDLCNIRNLNVFDMPGKTVQNLLSLAPSQAYFITRAGVTRLCQLDRDSSSTVQHRYYSNQFPATTLFQDRPYFEPAVAGTRNQNDRSASKFFYPTLPYIDLGGNGFVQTFCRTMPVVAPLASQSHAQAGSQVAADSDATEAVLCVDFGLAVNADKVVRTKIVDLGGTAVGIWCNMGTCTEAQEKDTMWSLLRRSLFGYDAASQDELLKISAEIRRLNNRKELSELFGKIYVYPDDGSSALKFTVPLSHAPREGAVDDRYLLYGKLDVHKYQHFISLLAISAGGCLLLAIGCVALIFADYGLKLKEQERAFSAVDAVMEKVPVAYARLDDEGKIIRINEELGVVLGFKAEVAAYGYLVGMKYEDLLADPASIAEFHANKAERKAGKPPRPYSVRLWKGGLKKERISCEVHGADIPQPALKRGKLGASFGILLKDPDQRADQPALQVVSKSS